LPCRTRAVGVHVCTHLRELLEAEARLLSDVKYRAVSAIDQCEIVAHEPFTLRQLIFKQLRELEADGIVHRRIYPTVPPKVEYSLTDYGRSLKRALQAICDWGRIHMERINAVQVPPDRVAKAKPLGREA
jgi:HxlR-like helix-turn-helix